MVRRSRPATLAWPSSQDPWFRPVDIKLGPDGALYIADWYDRQVNHYRNHEGQIDSGNGRIYRLRARDCRPPFTKPFDLSRLTTAELVELLAPPANGPGRQPSG